MHPATHGKRRVHRGRADHVPGGCAAQQACGALLAGAHQRYGTAARGFGPVLRNVLAQGGVFIIGHAHEAGQVHFWPSHARLISLAKHAGRAAASEANGFELGTAHGLVGAGQGRAWLDA